MGKDRSKGYIIHLDGAGEAGLACIAHGGKHSPVALRKVDDTSMYDPPVEQGMTALACPACGRGVVIKPAQSPMEV